MPETRELVLFHIPQSRSITVLWLLEELGRPYRIHRLDIRKNEQRGAEYRRLNPSGKVPAVQDGDQVLIERGAIRITPASPWAASRPHRRSTAPDYLRWMFYAIGVMEPLMALRPAQDRAEGPAGARSGASGTP
jgi:glutathione S-transferase